MTVAFGLAMALGAGPAAARGTGEELTCPAFSDPQSTVVAPGRASTRPEPTTAAAPAPQRLVDVIVGSVFAGPGGVRAAVFWPNPPARLQRGTGEDLFVREGLRAAVTDLVGIWTKLAPANLQRIVIPVWFAGNLRRPGLARVSANFTPTLVAFTIIDVNFEPSVDAQLEARAAVTLYSLNPSKSLGGIFHLPRAIEVESNATTRDRAALAAGLDTPEVAAQAASAAPGTWWNVRIPWPSRRGGETRDRSMRLYKDADGQVHVMAIARWISD